MAVPVRIVDPLDAEGLGGLRLERVDYPYELTNGGLPGKRVIHKFGRAVVGTSFAPVCLGGVRPMPQPAAATQLRVKAGDTNDTAAGSGAREVTLLFLDQTGRPIMETLPTNGTSASGATQNKAIRLDRWWISLSGTYATAANMASHADDVVIENAAGGTDWATIESLSGTFPHGQSEIAAYAIPAGKKASIKNIHVWVDAAKSSDILLMQRQCILDAAAPYQAFRLVVAAHGVIAPFSFGLDAPLGPFPPLTDLCFFAKVGASTGDVTVDFEIHEEDI